MCDTCVKAETAFNDMKAKYEAAQDTRDEAYAVYRYAWRSPDGTWDEYNRAKEAYVSAKRDVAALVPKYNLAWLKYSNTTELHAKTRKWFKGK